MYVSLGAFSASFIFAGLFLLQDFNIKRKKFTGFLRGLPSLELMGLLNFLSLTVGTVSLLAGVLFGLFHFERLKLDGALLWEPFVLFSLVMLVAYVFLLSLRLKYRERGRRYAFVSFAAYAFLIFAWVAARQGGGMLH